MADYSPYFVQHWPRLQHAAVFSPHPNPTYRNPAFADAVARVLIARLSPFDDVDRSAPHLVLAQFVRRALPDAYIDMAFFPPRHDRERLSQAGIPLLVGTQSFRSADDFDVLLVSNAYLLELINLPYLMLHSGIPLWASERGDEWAPIVLGGSNATATQAIVADDSDCLADALFFGEGEEQIIPLVRALCPAGSASKRQRLDGAAAAVPGLWLAGSGFDQVIEPAVVSSPGPEHLLTQFPSLNGPEAGTARLQISYGCPAFCGFCFEGYDRKPYREVSREDVVAAAQALKVTQGCDAVELDAFNFNTHSSISALLYDLNRVFDRVSFMSQRVDLLASTPGLLEAEVAAGKRHFTLGIEGISERQRAFLHKSLTEAAIRSVLEATLKHRPRQVKLFYLLTGQEGEEDLAAFRDFVSWLRTVRSRLGASPRVTFSFGWLIRMPFTPLRYDRLLLDPDDWRTITGPVKSICETNGFEFRLAMEWDAYCASQILAVGGHWLSRGVVALSEGGHCFDGGLTPGYWDEFRSWLVREGHWDSSLLGEKGRDYPFPMTFIQPRVHSDFLYGKFEKAKACHDEGYCLGTVARPGRCLACGACEDGEQRERIVGHAIHPVPTLADARRLAEMLQKKRRARPVFVRAWIPPTFCGAEPEWLNAACLRSILGRQACVCDNLLSAREALFSAPANRGQYPAFAGETVFVLEAWDPAQLVFDLFPSEPCALHEPTGAGEPFRARLPALGFDEGGASEEVRLLGFAAGFEPGRFSRATLTLGLPREHFPDPGDRLVRYLRTSYVACNVRKVGAKTALEIPKKAVKKKSVFGGEIEEDDRRTVVRLTVGPKFDLGGFLASFGERGSHRYAEVAFSDVMW